MASRLFFSDASIAISSPASRLGLQFSMSQNNPQEGRDKNPLENGRVENTLLIHATLYTSSGVCQEKRARTKSDCLPVGSAVGLAPCGCCSGSSPPISPWLGLLFVLALVFSAIPVPATFALASW